MHKIREFLEAGTLVPVAFGQSPGEVRQAPGESAGSGRDVQTANLEVRSDADWVPAR